MSSTNYQGLHIVGIGGTLRPKSRSRWALELALEAAENAGASIELLDLNKLDLPMYAPDQPLEFFGKNVAKFIASAQAADAMLWSTADYHGTLAGVTKNAIDFLEFLPRGALKNKVVGLIAVAGGEVAGVNAINAMSHSVHSLHGMLAPRHVIVPQAWRAFDDDGNLRDAKRAQRLEMLGELVLEMAGQLQSQREPAHQVAAVST